jgi:hypothetical protein
MPSGTNNLEVICDVNLFGSSGMSTVKIIKVAKKEKKKILIPR